MYSTPNGFVVLIGRNNRQNAELSGKVAKSNDMWFHARGVPGAHVVLKTQDGKDAQAVDIMCAANLAAWFSKVGLVCRSRASTGTPAEGDGCPCGMSICGLLRCLWDQKCLKNACNMDVAI